MFFNKADSKIYVSSKNSQEDFNAAQYGTEMTVGMGIPRGTGKKNPRETAVQEEQTDAAHLNWRFSGLREPLRG